MTRRQEVESKVDRVRAFIAEHDLDGVVLTKQSHISWLLAGVQDVVVRSGDPAFAWPVITADRAYLVALNNEEARLREEEGVGDLGLEVRTGPWWETDLSALATEIVASDRLAHDGLGPGKDLSSQLQRLRLQMVASEQARYRELGADVCWAVEHSLLELTARDLDVLSGYELASRIVARLETRGVLAGGLLIGGATRRIDFRHPTVSSAPLHGEVLVVVVGVRGGQHVALSRAAVGDGLSDETRARHELACTVEGALIKESRPGRSWTEALLLGLDAYATGGVAEEWMEHTQGGPIGYGPREFVAVPNPPVGHPSALAIQGQEAFAWNPTVKGSKSEDTFILVGGRAEPISNSDEWPGLVVQTRDGEIGRPAVLEL